MTTALPGSSTIWWIRRDLRLTDNQALTAAKGEADQVIPLFILDPALLNAPNRSDKRLAFLLAGLRHLDEDLRARGGRLIIRQGEPRDVLTALVAESGAKAIFAEADFSPYARRRDAWVAESLPLHLVGGLTVYHPQMVLKPDGEPYTVFTPFSRAWKALAIPRDLGGIPEAILTPTDLSSQPIPAEPALSASIPFPPGETEALCSLDAFARGDSAPIYQYAQKRNQLDLAGTSGLSPYLRFGMLSACQAVVAAQEAIEAAPTAEARKGAETWLNELIWREFYISILYHFPSVRRQSFQAKRRQISWLNNETDFAAWGAGRTGYPVVDAAMRQLLCTGWLHNRARMIVASFLVKDLLIDWRWGESWFMQHLVDGDPAANNGGWQWTAGTGTDAAPYFRVFNPILQSKKFDPSGSYIRRWLPELALVPDQYIHEPWQMSLAMQYEIGCIIGQDYPAPIVDHKKARKRALAAYKEAET